MNEPLKFKLFSVYGKILHKDVLKEAFRKVKKNKGCAGIDKISIKKFEENLDDNIDLISNKDVQAFSGKAKVYTKEKWKAKTFGNTNY